MLFVGPTSRRHGVTRGISVLAVVVALVCLNTTGFAQISKPTALLKGEVRSDEDQTVVAGLQVAVIKGTERVATAKTNVDGKFTAIVPPGSQYRINYTSKDFAFREDTIVIPAADKYQEVPIRTTVTPLRENQDFTPKLPVFKHGSASIETSAADRLDQLATLVRKNARVHLEIMVYPDVEIRSKKDAAQQKLLDARATTLRTFFLSRNIQPSSVAVVAMPVQGGGAQNVALAPVAAKGKKKAASTAAKGAPIALAVRITGHLS